VKEPFDLVHLYVSPGHNYFGRHGLTPGQSPVQEMSEVNCVAGRGIEGDRFFDHGADYKGQITFFADEVYRSLCEQFDAHDKPSSVFRRNVITRGVDLHELIGREFEIQGVRYSGTEECRPCHWMDLAFCPGAEAALRGHGGLRARILTSGVLRVGERPVFRRDPARAEIEQEMIEACQKTACLARAGA
jgi:MOSC domain-containing protein YiiM